MAGHGEPKPMQAEPSGPLRGRVDVPGDKSISHRALILGALAVGETRISGLLEGQDVLDTGRAMRAFGATVERTGAGARVEVAQVEAAAHWIGEYVLEQLETGGTWRPDGNAAAGFAPHDAYPCLGEDQWLAVAVGDDETWRALCAVLERPDLAADPHLAAAAPKREGTRPPSRPLPPKHPAGSQHRLYEPI